MPTSNLLSVLLDTNILLRLASKSNPLNGICAQAMSSLDQLGGTVYICPQNIQEYRQVATRPVASNGFGWSSDDVRRDTDVLEREYTLVPETPAIYPEWRRIVEATGAIGRANFDARLVAVAAVYGINAILTFEDSAFARYATFVPGLAILDPHSPHSF